MALTIKTETLKATTSPTFEALRKQRNGPIGTVRLTFNGQWSRFDNYGGPEYHDDD